LTRPGAPARGFLAATLAAAKHRRAFLHERSHAFFRVLGLPGDVLREGFELEPGAQIDILVVIIVRLASAIATGGPAAILRASLSVSSISASGATRR